MRVFYHERNQGKGAALRTLIPQARGEFCIVQDGDLEYHPEDYLPILAAFAAQKVDLGAKIQLGDMEFDLQE